ncbi:MAG: Gldg family protein [Planctomycetia bacterium]|nr:Gldg family protein [Planctomycetia bacterium]
MDSAPTESATAKPLNVAAILFVLAALWVVPAAWCGYKVFKVGPTATEKDPANPDAPPKEIVSIDENRPSYVVTLVLSAFGSIAALGGGLWLSSAKPTYAPEQHARIGSILLAVIGGVAGLLLAGLAVWFLIVDYQLLADWLTKKDTKTKDLWRVLVPALVFVAGGGLAFFAAQPARRLERHDQTARRLVYGTNFAVTGVLLFAALVVLNGFVALRVPQRLDTTASGYYSIAPSTEEYVRNLAEKVTVYNFGTPSDQGSAETQVLLQACQDLNPSKFVVRMLGRGMSAAEFQKLRAKFPSVDYSNVAMIVALGEDETRYSSIRDTELIRQEGEMGEGPPRVFYEGESRFVRELLFLSEGKNKSTVYFTQGNGELALGPTGGQRPAKERSIGELKAFLEKQNLNVQPLPFDSKTPKLPEDAAVIVVADPTLPLPKELAEELTKFMTVEKNGKKGKLIVLAGPHGTPRGDAVISTGLDELLKTFNVQLAPGFLFNRPNEQFPAELVIGLASPELQASGHPVAGSLPPARQGRPVPMPNARAIEILPNPNPAIQATALVQTLGGELFTWQEPDAQVDTDATFKKLMAQYKVNPRDTAQKKKMSADPVVLAAVVSEGNTPRMVVVGNGELFNDASAALQKENMGFKLVHASIDWLRDRPVVDVASKQFGFYTPQAKMDRMRLLFLPFGLAVLGIVGLSAGVWVIRRK